MDIQQEALLIAVGDLAEALYRAQPQSYLETLRVSRQIVQAGRLGTHPLTAAQLQARQLALQLLEKPLAPPPDRR